MAIQISGTTVIDDSSAATLTKATISTSGDEKIVLSGSNTPYIRWQEGTTDKAYIQWNTDGYLQFRNQESGSFRFRPNSTTAPIYLGFEGSDGDYYGGVYATHSNEIGFLDQDGQWAYRHQSDSIHEWRINNGIEMSLTTATLDMKGNTITEVEDIGLRDRIYHDGDTDTTMRFFDNEISLQAQGSEGARIKYGKITSPNVYVSGTNAGDTQVLTSSAGSVQLRNIASLDSTTTSTIQAVAAGGGATEAFADGDRSNNLIPFGFVSSHTRSIKVLKPGGFVVGFTTDLGLNQTVAIYERPNGASNSSGQTQLTSFYDIAIYVNTTSSNKNVWVDNAQQAFVVNFS